MLAGERQIYTAPHIGIVDQRVHDLYVHFLSQQGPERARELFYEPPLYPSLFRPRIGLDELNDALEGFPKPLQTLDVTMGQQWGFWHLGITRALGETFLKFSGEIGDRIFVQSSEVYLSIREVARNGSHGLSVEIDPETLRCKQSRTFILLPDVMALDPQGDRPTISDFYDFRRMIPSSTDKGFQTHIQSIATTLNAIETRTVLEEILMERFHLAKPELPTTQHSRFRLATAFKSPSRQVEPELLASAHGLNIYFDNNLAMDVQILPLAYFVLEMLTGRLPAVASPEEYFTPVHA